MYGLVSCFLLNFWPITKTSFITLFTPFQQRWTVILARSTSVSSSVTISTLQPLKTFRLPWLALITTAENIHTNACSQVNFAGQFSCKSWFYCEQTAGPRSGNFCTHAIYMFRLPFFMQIVYVLDLHFKGQNSNKKNWVVQTLLFRKWWQMEQILPTQKVVYGL